MQLMYSKNDPLTKDEIIVRQSMLIMELKDKLKKIFMPKGKPNPVGRPKLATEKLKKAVKIEIALAFVLVG